MAMILDAFIGKCSALLTDFVEEEVIMLLGVKGELQKLQQRMISIRSLLHDAEKRKFDDSSIDHCLSQLKDAMYDADDIIDLCRIEGAQLLADKNPPFKTSSVCCSFSSAFSCFTSVPLRHAIGNSIKDLNNRLNRIYEFRKQYKLERFSVPDTPQITVIDSRQTSSMVDDVVVGKEVEVAANALAELLVTEKGQEKCRPFALTGIGGIGKTTLAQKIFNHPKIQTYFNLKAWVCVSQTYSETELLQQVIRGAKGNYGNAETKSELQPVLRDIVVSGNSFFLVLDDVWRADVWVDLLRIPLQSAMANAKVLVTTRYEDVARDMEAAYIHPMKILSIESSWDMLRRRLFLDGQEELTDGLKALGFRILERCGGLPLAIKAIAGVLARKERTRKEWERVLMNDAWSITKLPEELRGALFLSYDDLPSDLKQCFLFCSLFPEDDVLYRRDLSRLWVAEGLITEQRDSLIEDLAIEYFNELVRRNLLLPDSFNVLGDTCQMHDLVRSLARFLSKEEASCGDLNLKSSSSSTKLRRFPVKRRFEATSVLDSVAEKGSLRTLLASHTDILLDDERLRQLSHLRVLHIKRTPIRVLPDSIGNLVHLRYLDLDGTEITSIPESIANLTNLLFLNICHCYNLTRLPNGITKLLNLRRLGLYKTPLSFIPKGIGRLQQLNDLSGFVVANNDSCSKLEELNSLKQMRMLSICKLDKAQSRDIILRDLPYLSDLKLFFAVEEPDADGLEAVEKLFDELVPPRSLEELNITRFFGRRFPYWMALSSFENCVPYLTRLELVDILSCTQLPSLGQLPELKLLTITNVRSVKKIGQEFLVGDINSTTRIAFPKLELFRIGYMYELEEWSFGAQVEQNASPRLRLLPCLQELSITACPLLKQLPQGLKYSGMKSLRVVLSNSLKVVDDLPREMESLHILDNKELESVRSLPALKKLVVRNCKASICVEKLDALVELEFFDNIKENLPEWLLMLLKQRGLQNDANGDFLLKLRCPEKVLRECLKGGSYWDIMQHIPSVIAFECSHGIGYIRYSKHPYIYDTFLCIVLF